MEENLKELLEFYDTLLKKIPKDFPKDNPDDVKKSLNEFWNCLIDVIGKKFKIKGKIHEK